MRWLLVSWLFLMSAIAYLDRVNISIAGGAIAREFRLSNIQLGWVFSAFLLGYALFQAPAGRLADRLGPRLVLTLSVFWWAVFTVLITLLPTHTAGVLAVLLATRFCLGIGEAVMYPASNRFVAAWIPASERGRANGLIFAGVGFGAAVTAPLITSVMLQDGWRMGFYLSALIGLVAGAAWYLLARNQPAEHPLLSEGELDYIQKGLPLRKEVIEERGLPWRAILRNRDLLAVTFSYFAFGYVAQIFFSWFFIYLSEVRGVNLRQSSFYTVLPFVAMSIGSISGGVVSDRVTRQFGERAGHCGVAGAGLGVCALFLLFGARAASPELATVVLAGGAGALYLSQSSFWSVSAKVGGTSAGTVSGVMNMGGQLGGALTASLTPAIANRWGWVVSFLVASALCAAGALAWLRVGRSEGATLWPKTESPSFVKG